MGLDVLFHLLSLSLYGNARADRSTDGQCRWLVGRLTGWLIHRLIDRSAQFTLARFRWVGSLPLSVRFQHRPALAGYGVSIAFLAW